MMKNKKGFTLPNFSKKNLGGFTLIELLVVIAIISILAAAVIVGINPARHFRQARQSTRWSHMNAISTAVYSYAVEHGGNFPRTEADEYGCIGTPGNAVEILIVLDADGNMTDGTWCFGEDKIVPEYLRVPPADPLDGENYLIEFVDNKGGIKITSTAQEARDEGVELIQ